ncbi:MAG: hypothetical protein H6740_08805 [Alphaproteobacteria bacterium]|nr:hypothetical protein [Alphaproteobacteria bacterium]
MSALLLATLACTPEGVVQQGDEVLALAPTAEGRLEKALASVGPSTPHDYLLTLIKNRDGGILVDAPDKVSGLPEDRPLLGVLDDPELSAALWGRDEAALIEIMEKRGARMLLLHRDVEPSVDRGARVASRLYHDDFRERFKLLAADSEHLLYEPSAGIPDFPRAFVNFLAVRLRELIRTEGRTRVEFPRLEPPVGSRWNLVATVRPLSGGRAQTIGMCWREELGECVVELARDLEREHRRYKEWWGLPRLSTVIDDSILELHLVYERARVLAFQPDDFADLWEMGVDGAVIIDKKDRRAAIVPGAVAYTRAYRDPERMLRHLSSQFALNEVRPWLNPENTLEKMRTVHVQHRPDGEILPMQRGVPPVVQRQVDLEAVKQGVVLAGEWYLRNMHPNDQPLPHMQPGQVTYKQWPSENRYHDEYNLVRHTLATWNLVQAWHLDPRPEFLEGARRALDFTLSNRVDEGEMSFLQYNDNRKLGAVVVGLMGMIDLARATGSTEWDPLMERFGAFTLSMQEEDGRFDPYYVPEGHPYDDEVNDIVPGEAALALVMLYEYTGDEKYLAPLPKFLDYYEPWWDLRVGQRLLEGPWPTHAYPDQTRLELVQFGPWTVMACNAYHRVSGDARFAEFGLEVARWMVETYQWDAERAPWPDYIGGYYKNPEELPAMQAFVYAEGTAAAYDLALRAKPEEAAFFRDATWASMRFALQMQYDDDQLYPFSRGDEVRGGVRYTMVETKVRIDYVYHAVSAMWQFIQAAERDPNLPEEIRRSRYRQLLEVMDQPAPALPPEGR